MPAAALSRLLLLPAAVGQVHGHHAGHADMQKGEGSVAQFNVAGDPGIRSKNRTLAPLSKIESILIKFIIYD